MAFITNDGNLLQVEPWGRRSVTFFLGIVHMFFMFFRSLLNPIMMMFGTDTESSGSFGSSTRDYRPGSGPGGRGGGPPSRRIGRPNTGSSISTPGPACGGCCG